MSTLIKDYPVFEDNQVLTSSQLNELHNYLDQQNRLTRASLIGIGVVCGMDVLCSPGHDKLTITRGVGVTSEGYLMTIGECITTRYREYTKPDSVSYPPFEDPDTQKQDVELFELLTAGAETDNEDEVVDVDEEFLKDKMVLLFLEFFDKDLKSCLGKSCDELGIKRIMTLRKLVISKEDFEKVKNRSDGGMLDASYAGKYELPALRIKRLVIASGTPASLYYTGMTSEYLQIISEVWKDLFKALYNSYVVYEPVLNEVYEKNPFDSDIIRNIRTELEAFMKLFYTFKEPVFGIQYFYGFVKDMILAYEEFRVTAFELSGVCCPDMSCFPKHLMLGQACSNSDSLCEPVEYRNKFVASPAFSQQQQLSERVKMLHKRLVLMLESFDTSRLKNPEKWAIKITPSFEKTSFLSARAIPYYYNSKKESQFEGLGSLENNWNFDLERQCLKNADPKQVSYDNHELNSGKDDPVSTPLRYDLDAFNFLRIEGHIGKQTERVEKQLDKMKKEYNLSFDTKSVYFGDLAEDSAIPDCLIGGLQTQYSIWRNKILLILKNMVKTSKTTERIILNRHMMSSDKATDFSKKDSNFSEKSKIHFKTSDFTNVFMGTDPVSSAESAERIYSMISNLEHAGSRKNVSRTASFESNTDKSVKQLFSSLNDCMHNLIDAMPVNFKNFEMQAWLEHYKCVLRVVIQLMKWIAGNVDSNQGLTIAIVRLFVIIWGVHKALSFLSIYPYITIRILNDTLQERREALGKSLQLSRFSDNNSGIDHKAGVAPGQTFLLVYQRPQSFDHFNGKIIDGIKTKMMRSSDNPLFEFDDKKFSFDRYVESIKGMENLVVADFTLPFICRDDCKDVSSKAVTLDPLATPVAEISTPKLAHSDKAMTHLKFEVVGYESVETQLINNLYNPDIYKADIISEPKFGFFEFRNDPYEPDNSKTKQILVYNVDFKSLAAEAQLTSDSFIIDEFDYQIRDENRNEIVGGDTITIFIPVDRLTKPQTGIIHGTVKAQGEPLPGANISVEGTALGTVTNMSGEYTLGNVPAGQQTIIASFTGYGTQRINTTIESGTNVVDFILSEPLVVDINFDRILISKGIRDHTSDAEKVRVYYYTTMSEVKKTADELVKEEGRGTVTPVTKTADTIRYFSDEENINVVRMNNEYNTRRNELTKQIQSSRGTEKDLYIRALQNLTEAYLTRLAYTQPKKLTRTTKDLLGETATIFNAEKDINIKSTLEQWQKKSEGYVSEDFKNNLRVSFKLR